MLLNTYSEVGIDLRYVHKSISAEAMQFSTNLKPLECQIVYLVPRLPRYGFIGAITANIHPTSLHMTVLGLITVKLALSSFYISLYT